MKQYILDTLESSRGDDLERALLAFRRFNPDEMKALHINSEKTRQQVLDGYRKERAQHEEAIEFAKTHLP